MDIVGQCC